MLKSIVIDEEGFFVFSQGQRLTDPVEGRKLFSNLSMNESYAIYTEWDGERVIVEPFDKPLVVQQIHRQGNDWHLQFPYGFEAPLLPETLTLDSWDRFHGFTDKQIPFVFSRSAQADFFNLLDSFDDDSITLAGKTYEMPPYYLEREDVGTGTFWQNIYQKPEKPHWDLEGPHPAIEAVLPQIKIVKSRIVNFGCGKGHDAAALASKGHIVKGVDLSPAAIEFANKNYGGPANLQFIQDDVFKNSYTADVIFEHTLFCALSPGQRKALVKRWHQCLEPGGYLLGIFFVNPKRHGPPYGGSEWELRSLLEKNFRLLYWKRWGASPPGREGTELVVFAQKLAK